MSAHGSGNIRHELRTPLNHILGYSEMLLEELDGSTSPQADGLARINTIGKALLDYVNGFSADEVKRANSGLLPEAEWRSATDDIAAICAGLSAGLSDEGVATWRGDLEKIASANGTLVQLFREGLERRITTVGSAATGAEGGEPVAPSARAEVSGGELLVVDDNPENRELLARRLSREGYTVETAESGRAALELIGLKRFELILLDLMMPEMNGIEVLGAVRQRFSHTELPVIMVTAKSASEDVVQALECGANDYVTKPIDFPVVRARISTQLSLRRLTRELEVANEKLHRFSYMDGLTEIPNRRHFDEYLEREWVRAARTRQPLSLVIIDVDHFKPFNDNYGHEAGDRVLKQVAGALTGGLMRGGDLVARYGGEEFVAVLPQTTAQGAVELAELLRARVAGLKIPHAHSSSAPYVTASFGVCSLVPGSGDDKERLLKGADNALYHAKGLTRNCVCCLGDTTKPGECTIGCGTRPVGCLAPAA